MVYRLVIYYWLRSTSLVEDYTRHCRLAFILGAIPKIRQCNQKGLSVALSINGYSVTNGHLCWHKTRSYMVTFPPAENDYQRLLLRTLVTPLCMPDWLPFITTGNWVVGGNLYNRQHDLIVSVGVEIWTCFFKNPQPIPRYFSKNVLSFSITVCFLEDLPLSEKRETGGNILSKSVPVVFITPSRSELSIYFRVLSDFSFSASMIADKSFSFCSLTKMRQSLSTWVEVLTRLIKPSISSLLLRSSILAPTALSIDSRMLLSVLLNSVWDFAERFRD